MFYKLVSTDKGRAVLINNASRIPKHVQTAILLKRRIEKGDYIPGTQFPPVRTLGAELGVSSNVIQRAVQILEKEGVVESRHGIGVQVLKKAKARRTPLTFGMIIPYGPETRFAGSIHCFADKALDVAENHCIVKSSCHDPIRERRLVEQFVDTGIEGLMIWPCEGRNNVDFFNEVSQKAPVVFVDRRLEGVMAPSVVLDFAGVGRDIVTYLGRQGFRRILMLEDPIPISSYREMYSAMKQTVDEIHAMDRFHFITMNASEFVDAYQQAPEEHIAAFTHRLRKILQAADYDALFCPQVEFIDYVFIGTDLATAFPAIRPFSISNTMPTPRSLAYYQRGVREWIGDFGQVIGKAAEILHDMVYLRNRPQRQHRIKFTSLVRNAARHMQS